MPENCLDYAGKTGVRSTFCVYSEGLSIFMHYRLPALAHDLAPELRMVAQEALDELRRLGGEARMLGRLAAALSR
jgi:hypothetical protein